MKLETYCIIQGVICCESGLRIGGSKEALEIGAMDNPIIRHPVTGLPYIPGSSIKGKMRSLLELKAGTFNQVKGGPCDCGECDICLMFGCGNPQKAKEMTRLIFRDAKITPESEKTLRDAQAETGCNFSEVKSENWIDRRSGIAGRGGLRTQERVPEGTNFCFELSVRIFDKDNREQFMEKITDGMRLMENDYLGGSGSRGYGKIKFANLTRDGVDFSL